jgi:hypothetical protein
MTTIARWGLAAKLPLGWEARIFKRAPEAPTETTHPVLHAASFALPPDRGDFGSGAVDLMGPDDVFVTVIEYDRSAAGTALFARQGMPTAVDASQFSPTTLQRLIPGQAGTQVFFSDRGRAFCLYVVLGSWARADALIPRANALIAGLAVQ